MSLKKSLALFALLSLGVLIAARAEEIDPKTEFEPGLVGEYFQAQHALAEFFSFPATTKPTYVRVDKQINFGDTNETFYGTRLKDNFQVRWTGFIKIETEGKYEIAAQSDDGSRVAIDGKVVVDNGGIHPSVLKTGSVELKPGMHKIKIDFFQGGGGAECIVGWTAPKGKRENIPASVLFHVKGADKKIEYDEAAWKKLPEGSKETVGHAKIGGGAGSGGAAKGNPIHEKMDYGPFLSGTIESNYPAGGNYALKGLAIRLGDKKQAAVSFDTEMLRYSVGWTGDYLKLDYGRDGLEGHPTLRGTPKFGTKGTSIGWANKDGEFQVKVKDKDGKEKLDDPRVKSTAGNRPEGPLPKDWAKYKGVYLDGRSVILSYTVGDAEVLEAPSFDDSDGLNVFARTFRIGKTTKPLTMLLLEDEKPEAATFVEKKIAGLAVKAKYSTKVKEGDTEVSKESTEDSFISAAISGAPEGVEFARDENRLLVKIPALTETANFTIKICTHPVADKAKFAALIGKKVIVPDFDKVMKSGGTPRWKPIVEKGELAKDDDKSAYVTDIITVPYKNDYDAYMRLTGVDFFKDGRAAVCTMSGDVWIVSGIDKTLEKITWQRFATGLFATLGLKIVDDQIYTLGRDQITRFYDYNNDGEADYYECFNNDVQVGPDYHEFAHDLHTDTEGNFYFMKGSNLGQGGAPLHGTMVKVDKKGEKAEMFCKGFRAPNGMCVGPNNEITTGDNQGNWTPSSPINWIKKDGFYGFQLDQYPESKVGPRLNPLCWIPYKEDNSCGGQVWGGPNWGPLSNRLLHMSYGQSKLFSVIIEKYNDDVQGGVVKFPLPFQSGIMRARVNKADGQVYCVGMRGWQTNGVKDGTFQRVRYTGKPYNAPLEVKTANNGLSVTFASALDKESVEDKEAWSCERFNIKYTSEYGSPEFSLKDPSKKEHDKVEVKSVKLDADGKTVKVELEDVKLCTNMVLKYKIKAADGTTITQELDYTINFIPGGEKSPGMFPPAPKKKDEPKKEEPKKAEAKK